MSANLFLRNLFSRDSSQLCAAMALSQAPEGMEDTDVDQQGGHVVVYLPSSFVVLLDLGSVLLGINQICFVFLDLGTLIATDE
jgi:hypothetical protein